MLVKEFVLLPGLGGDDATMNSVHRRLARAFPEIQSSTLVGDFPITSKAETRLGWFRYPKDSERELEQTGKDSLEHLENSIRRIHVQLDARILAGCSSTELGIIGHSQGGAMALAAGLTYPRPLGFVCSIAGYLVLPALANPVVTSTRYLLLHGQQDDVVNVRWSHYAHQWLIDRGFHAEIEVGQFDIFPHGMHARQISAIIDRLS